MGKRRRSRVSRTCYMCNRPATSREHVPPLCFFPEQNEFPGAGDFRQNLITVPSCDEHNLAKSNDDQYMCAVLAAHFENNNTAQSHFSAKIIPSLVRKPSMFFGFFRPLAPALVRGAKSVAFAMDRNRFDHAVDHIARGVFFHHFSQKYTGRANVMSYSLYDVSSPVRSSVNQKLQEWRRYSDDFLANHPKYGNNPSIFYYQILSDASIGRMNIRLVFYDGFVVDVYFLDAPLATQSTTQ